MEDERAAEQVTGRDEAPEQGEETEREGERPRVQFTPEQQREIDRIIAERLERERRRREQEAQRAAQRAREEMLAQQQEWQRLAEERAARIAELEQQVARVQELEAQVERYRALLQRHVEAQLRTAPRVIREALQRLDPLEQFEFLAEHADEIRPPAPVPPTPEGGQVPRLTEEERRRRAVSVRDLW